MDFECWTLVRALWRCGGNAFVEFVRIGASSCLFTIDCCE